AVVFAMLASYGLSRTLTPITIGLLLKGEGHGDEEGWFTHFHNRLERRFDRLRDGYAELLLTLLTRPEPSCQSSPQRSSLSAPPCISSSGATSSRSLMAGRSSFTSAPRPAPASRRPSRSS